MKLIMQHVEEEGSQNNGVVEFCENYAKSKLEKSKKKTHLRSQLIKKSSDSICREVIIR